MSEPDLNQQTREQRQAIMDGAQRRLNARQDGRSIVKFISAAVDDLIIELWRQIAGPAQPQVDIVAVGGYGRAELCPYSDWDLLFLVPNSNDEAIGKAIQRTLQVLWDSGAQIGHAVRTPAEAKRHVEDDHHARTALLESRLLTGDGALYGQVQKRCSQEHWSKKQRTNFCLQKIAECHERHQAMGDTAFLMEPDIKNGKGGLRDISTIFWLSMAWYGVPTARELVGQVVSEKEFNGFWRARNFLWRVRTGLHLLAGREDDRLRFEHQPELAASFRFRDDARIHAVERFLKTYFLNVRTIADLSDTFLLYFEEQVDPPRRWRRVVDLGDGMVLRAGKLSIDDEQAFAADPLNLIRVFVEAQKEHRYLDSRALRVIRSNIRLVNARLRATRAANEMFLQILRSPRNVATILGQMHQTGVLGRFVPDFGRITGHCQFDRYHSYTVDAHTIRAIDILRDFRLGEGQFIEMPLASKLMKQLQRPELLFLALLFHDIAKGRGTDHSELGEKLASRFCARLGLPLDDVELVAWLVREHLTFSRTAQHYDLSDPEVIATFTGLVGDRERLIDLFLVTVADVTATAPGIWNDWKGALFTQLFEMTESYLLAGRVTPADHEHRLQSRRESVLELCDKTETDHVAGVLAVLSNTSLLHFPPAELLEVSRMLMKASATHAAVNKAVGYTRLLAWGIDQPKLFANITAVLANANVKVLTAHAYALKDGRILDEFHLVDQRDNPVTDPAQLVRIQERVQAVLDGGDPPALKYPTKPDVLMKALPIHVRRLEAAARTVTAIEVVAADRPGLLADLAMAIAELGIELRGANVSTFGEKAVDVFFLTDRDGRKLNDADTERAIERLTAAAELKLEAVN